MAEILGLGITHYPGLSPRNPQPKSLLKLLQDPGLPPELRDPANWPPTMRQEWGADDGAAAAARHRDEVAAEMRKVRTALDDFQPDFVVIWGDDQYENFREDIVPAFTLHAYDEMSFQPWSAPGSPPNRWDEPADTTFRARGHRTGAKGLATGLLEQGFDLAYAYKPLHHPLAHAFTNSLLYLDWDRTGFDIPVVPFSINCYGRRLIGLRGYMESLGSPMQEKDFDPPSPSPGRCFDLGAACARWLRDSPWRVALIASSSWSHAFLTRKNSYLYPDTPSDRRLFESLRQGDYGVWRDTSLAALEDSGQQELLNWFCLIGAMSELDRRADYAAFTETSIMNSNKVFATFAA